MSKIDERINALSRLLIEKKQQVAVAESCTGGELLALLTRAPGSSLWSWGGWVVYSNQAKNQLGVDKEIIKEHGAVSKQVVESLCYHAQKASQCQLTIAISGVAGPDGGTISKPVGTIWAGVRYKQYQQAQLLQLEGSRKTIRQLACERAIELSYTILANN